MKNADREELRTEIRETLEMKDRTKNSFYLVHKERNTIEKYDVLFTFDSEETGKSYIVYTDYSTDEKEGRTRIFASTCKENRLFPLESKKEWQVVETLLELLQEECRKKHKKEK